VTLANVHLEMLWTGSRWAEGPAYFAAGRYLVWSDIPNDRSMRYDETDGSVSVFRQPSHNANGHTVDLEGRLVSCEQPESLRDADRARWVAHRARRALPGQTPELAQRRWCQIRW